MGLVVGCVFFVFFVSLKVLGHFLFGFLFWSLIVFFLDWCNRSIPFLTEDNNHNNT